MPIKRKLIKIGRSYAVTLPMSWVKNAEETAGGKDMTDVTMEVNGHIVIKPVFGAKQK